MFNSSFKHAAEIKYKLKKGIVFKIKKKGNKLHNARNIFCFQTEGEKISAFGRRVRRFYFPYKGISCWRQLRRIYLYYDTPDYNLIRQSIEKPKYKEKLRLRSYGVPAKEDQVFLEIKKKYADKRRTAIVSQDNAVVATVDVNAKIERAGKLILTQAGNLKFMAPKSYSMAQKSIVNCGASDLVRKVMDCTNDYNLIAFTQKGNAVVFDIDQLGEDKWKSRGIAIGKIARADSDEKAIAVFTPAELEGKELYFYTKQGMVKKTEAKEYSLEKKTVSPSIVLKEGDELTGVEIVDPEDEYILFVTKKGMVLNAEADIPCQGKKASGVKGIQLADGDEVLFAAQHDCEGEIVVVTDVGFAKRVVLSSIEPMKRYRKGVTLNDDKKTGSIVFVDTVTMPYDFALQLVDGECLSVNTDDIDITDRTNKGKNVLKEACRKGGSNLSMIIADCKRHNI